MATMKRVAGDKALAEEIAGSLQDELAEVHGGDLTAMRQTWARVQVAVSRRLKGDATHES